MTKENTLVQQSPYSNSQLLIDQEMQLHPTCLLQVQRHDQEKSALDDQLKAGYLHSEDHRQQRKNMDQRHVDEHQSLKMELQDLQQSLRQHPDYKKLVEKQEQEHLLLTAKENKQPLELEVQLSFDSYERHNMLQELQRQNIDGEKYTKSELLQLLPHLKIEEEAILLEFKQLKNDYDKKQLSKVSDSSIENLNSDIVDATPTQEKNNDPIDIHQIYKKALADKFSGNYFLQYRIDLQIKKLEVIEKISYLKENGILAANLIESQVTDFQKTQHREKDLDLEVKQLLKSYEDPQPSKILDLSNNNLHVDVTDATPTQENNNQFQPITKSQSDILREKEVKYLHTQTIIQTRLNPLEEQEPQEAPTADDRLTDTNVPEPTDLSLDHCTINDPVEFTGGVFDNPNQNLQ